MPALAYVLARWAFGLSPEQTAIATVLAALPAAQNLNTYASVFQRGEKLARDATLITTIASVPVIAGICCLARGSEHPAVQGVSRSWTSCGSSSACIPAR